jgi:hypothetical protein
MFQYNTQCFGRKRNEIKRALQTPTTTVSSMLGKDVEITKLETTEKYFYQKRTNQNPRLLIKSQMLPMSVVQFKSHDLECESLKSFAEQRGMVPKGTSKNTYVEVLDAEIAANKLINKSHEKTTRAIAVNIVAEKCNVLLTPYLFKLIKSK